MALHLWLTATLPNLLIYSSIGYKINYHYYKTMNMQWNDNKTISSKIQEKLVKRKTMDSEMITKQLVPKFRKTSEKVTKNVALLSPWF